MQFERISINPAQMGGVPCIRGLRIPVATVVGLVAQGIPKASAQPASYLRTYALPKDNRQDMVVVSVTATEGKKYAHDFVYSWLAIVLLHK